MQLPRLPLERMNKQPRGISADLTTKDQGWWSDANNLGMIHFPTGLIEEKYFSEKMHIQYV